MVILIAIVIIIIIIIIGGPRWSPGRAPERGGRVLLTEILSACLISMREEHEKLELT